MSLVRAALDTFAVATMLVVPDRIRHGILLVGVVLRSCGQAFALTRASRDLGVRAKRSPAYGPGVFYLALGLDFRDTAFQHSGQLSDPHGFDVEQVKDNTGNHDLAIDATDLDFVNL